MGVWHETDGITQIPITEDVPIKLFVVLPMREFFGVDDYKGYTKHLTSATHPVFLPVSGIYDYYGGIKDIQEGIATQYIEDCIKKLYEDKRLLVNRRHSLYYKDDTTHWDILTALNSIGQGHYTFKGYTYDVESDLKQLEYQKILAESRVLLAKYGGADDEEPELFLEEIEKKEKELKQKTINLKFGLFFVIAELYDAVVDKMKHLNKKDTQKIGSWCVNHDYLHNSLKNKAKSLKSLVDNNKLTKHHLDDFFGFKTSLMGSMCCADPHIADFSELCLQQSSDRIKQVIDEFVDYKYFRYFMAYARKPWYVAADHRGAQDYEIYLHHVLAKATETYCKKQISRALKEAD